MKTYTHLQGTKNEVISGHKFFGYKKAHKYLRA